MRRILPLALILLAGPSGPALAHGGHVHWDAASTWTLGPAITVPLALAGGLYALGVVRLWRRAGPGRGVRLWQAGAFAAGWLFLAAALVSPLHWLGEQLFSAHMIEHEILMAAAAPLLVVARPGGAFLWAFPRPWRGPLARFFLARPVNVAWVFLTEPLAATIVHGVALWVWHLPALYEAALTHEGLHWLQHACFFGTALVFWWAILCGRGGTQAYGASVFYLFATGMHTGFLGILLTVARRPIFPLQTAAAAAWGLTPLEDQQLAGLVMWIPAGLVYAAAALALAGLWITRSGSGARGGGHAFAP